MLKAGLKLISVSIKYLPASPSPSSTSLRYIPLEECVSFAAWMLGWLRVQGYQILNSSNNYWFLSKLPPSKSHPDPGRQSAGDKAYEWKMEVANTQFSSDSQPWHQTQLVKFTESLPASHPNVGLPGCLIRQPVLQRGSPWDVYLGLPKPSVVCVCSWSLNVSYMCLLTAQVSSRCIHIQPHPCCEQTSSQRLTV